MARREYKVPKNFAFPHCMIKLLLFDFEIVCIDFKNALVYEKNQKRTTNWFRLSLKHKYAIYRGALACAHNRGKSIPYQEDVLPSHVWAEQWS